MARQALRVLTQTLVVIATIAFAVHPSQAGPGGGTYYANSPAGGASGAALRKFVDTLPGLGAANANNLGQYIPVAIPDTTSYPGSDYYEIGLKEYAQKLHSDLPKATTLRGYFQINTSDPTVQDINQYLGPLILAQAYDPTKPAGVAGNGKPVRIKFRNLLPTGGAGKLFIPMDSTMMGAGRGPAGSYPAQFGGLVPAFANYSGLYTENRATLHLHGGNSPWISDGTPHQWTVPVGELTTPFQKGMSTKDVPDMPASGQGEMTFYYTNQQSGRFMFYHDHSYGITRLNVYAGEAAGYLLTDATEEALINNGTLPNLGGLYRYGIPLVIQDKTFVPQNVELQDALWTRNSKGALNKWGTYGDLWFPHVYEPNQDPNSLSGANPFGRWDYGPWFWPPVLVDAAHATIPEPTTTPEAFGDTPLVNGTAYPYLMVAPKPYRFRILNACNDRTLNLSLFYVDPADPSGKEVRMVPAGPNPAFPADWPTDGREGGVPDPALIGPEMIQIGTEGGLLRHPVQIPNRPIGYDYNRRNIVVLNSLYRSLMLGAAERADVIIDFSAVPPGSKIILYNDAPTPNPAFDPRYDYYTGNPDQTLGGGAPSTLRGYGPNTRTIMQFQVAGTPGTPFNLANLQAALPAAFDATQPPPIIPQPWSGGINDIFGRIQDYSLTIPVNDAVVNPAPAPALAKTFPFHPKAIQELWDPYGRMNATLGIELPFTSSVIQTTIPLGYADTPTEIFTDGQPQIWKITHNGVDTHPVHFHQFNVQLVNRVGWDGAIRPPDDNELGWKETVRMNPLEDVVVALLPKAQVLPFALPKSVRPIDVTLPTSAGINIFLDPFRGITQGVVANVPIDYGYEYVWHCHILGHEENDFMRPMIFLVSDAPPPDPTALNAYLGGTTVPGDPTAPTAINPFLNNYVNQIVLQWADGLPANTLANPSDTSSFQIESSTDGGTTWVKDAIVSFLPQYPPIWTDTSVAPDTSYLYRVTAFNSFNNGSFSAPAVSAAVKTGNWSKATAVTLTASKPTPHVVGTIVQFTAQASGAASGVANTAVSYEYRFWLSTNGGARVMVRDYLTDPSWALPDTALVGNYVISVEARSSSVAAPDVTSSLNYQIVVPPIAPVTISSPVPGIYASAPVLVTLSASTLAPPASIYYTTDGTIPTTASAKYAGAITLAATGTINYFAVDVNGVAETVQSDTWVIHTSDLVASVTINNAATATNNPAVTLALSAFDPAGIASMQFSNDNLSYSAEEPFSSTKAWALSPGAGLKTVYVRFRDKALPTGVLYAPVTASITLDSVIPTSSASPVPGIYSNAPVMVSLAANKPAVIYYSTDGSTPTTGSPVYIGPIAVGATATIKYFAVDAAGNTEPVNTGVWTIHSLDLVASVKVNGGAPVTNSSAVTLALSAVDQSGIDTMQFSNDGINYTAEEAYATSKIWTLPPADGVKNLYVRFRDKSLPSGFLYAPVTTSITLDTLAPTTAAGPIPGSYAAAPVTVTLASNELATIYYSIDGSQPDTSSKVYTAPFPVTATTTVKYFAVDAAGNTEAVKTGTWTIHVSDLVANVQINNGAAVTNDAAVALSLSAIDPLGVATMQFSNDGINFSAEESYAVSKAWNLDPGDGVKHVYVRFRDKSLPAGELYAPVTAQIVLDTVAPVATAAPIPGNYATSPVMVTLTANESSAIYYSVDGSTPSSVSTLYTAPIPVSANSSVKYFAVDAAGNRGAVQTGVWTTHSSDLTASLRINNGAARLNATTVTLTPNAVDPVGIATMQFSNDGIVFSAEEPYATAKIWQLTPGDGVKTVYVRFRDRSLPAGYLYDPVSASTILDTVAPVTAAGPITGTYAAAPVVVSLTANKPATIHYTVDGSTPSAASPSYAGPITLAATTTIRYFATDLAGNAEEVKSGTWTIDPTVITASVRINNGAPITNSTAVTLTVSAADPVGVGTMQFSNDGVSYSVEEPYATTKAWTLAAGDGEKTVYARFRIMTLPAGHISPPFTSTITYGTKDGVLPGTSDYLTSAMKSLKMANGLAPVTPLDLAHCDVAPYINGIPAPDGKIDLLDVYALLMRLVGLVPL
jgi:FtsP/CotA-like multicopper oxidase with cupredoxin domain